MPLFNDPPAAYLAHNVATDTEFLFYSLDRVWSYFKESAGTRPLEKREHEGVYEYFDALSGEVLGTAYMIPFHHAAEVVE